MPPYFDIRLLVHAPEHVFPVMHACIEVKLTLKGLGVYACAHYPTIPTSGEFLEIRFV